MEPITLGNYPENMRIQARGRLPEFTEEETNMMKRSFDFIGFNYYGAMYAFNRPNSSSFSYTTDSEIEITGDLRSNIHFLHHVIHLEIRSLTFVYVPVGKKNGKAIGEQARNSSRIYIYPKGLREFLRHIKERYNNPVIYITENGTTQDPYLCASMSEISCFINFSKI